jgi:hypothetical protein
MFATSRHLVALSLTLLTEQQLLCGQGMGDSPPRRGPQPAVSETGACLGLTQAMWFMHQYQWCLACSGQCLPDLFSKARRQCNMRSVHLHVRSNTCSPAEGQPAVAHWVWSTPRGETKHTTLIVFETN